MPIRENLAPPSFLSAPFERYSPPNPSNGMLLAFSGNVFLAFYIKIDICFLLGYLGSFWSLNSFQMYICIINDIGIPDIPYEWVLRGIMPIMCVRFDISNFPQNANFGENNFKMRISTTESQRRESVADFFSRTDSPAGIGIFENKGTLEHSRVLRNSIFTFNEQLDKIGPPHDINENIIRGLLAESERFRGDNQSVYWLTVARLAELALINAGAYVDGCEFRTAGDLLANPSKILIHIKGRRFPVLKKRHGKLSEQLSPNGEAGKDFPDWFKKNASLEIREKALLPDLRDRMENSGAISPEHIEGFEKRMAKIADVLGFLSAWNVENSEALFAKMRTASPETREFVRSNLCNFDDALYRRIGRDIREFGKGTGCRGKVLATSAVLETRRAAV